MYMNLFVIKIEITSSSLCRILNLWLMMLQLGKMEKIILTVHFLQIQGGNPNL